MKNHSLVIVLLLVVLSCFAAEGALGGYDYCGKPCTERSGIVCAYNQRCYTVFTNLCEMRKRNCDFDDRFNNVQMSGCLLGVKCRGI